MIPKVLYYVWVGGNEKPDIFYQCLETWKKHLPDYDIVEINESNFNLKYHLENNSFFKVCYDRKMWAFVSDYMRVVHLYENGGIYLDTDMEIIKDFSKIINKGTEFFAGFEDNNNINAAIFGACKHSQVLKNVLKFYENDIWNSSLYTIPSIFTHILNDYLPINQKLCDSYYSQEIRLFPSYYFYPYHYTAKFSKECLTSNTYGIHWWSHSWNKVDDYIFLNTKHLSGFMKFKKISTIKLKVQVKKVINKYFS